MELQFCIDKRITGSEKHIVYSDGKLAFVDEPPVGVWHLKGDIVSGNTCMDTLFKLEHVGNVINVPENYVKTMKLVCPDVVNPPWVHVMSAHVYRDFLKKLINAVIEAMEGISQNYYVGTWVPSNVIFDKLVPAKIDRHRWLTLVREERTANNKATLATFEPKVDDFANLVSYNRMKTRTGRLSVSSGPQILTLKKDYRDIIKSRYGDDGVVLYVDFAALEVRIILHESGRWFDAADIYAKLANDIFQGKIDRAVIKGAVISELYGVSPQRLGKILGMNESEVMRFIGIVRTYFDVDALLARVKNQYARKGYVKNHYGRKVLIDEPLDRVLLNSYVQSTGVDVSLLGFSNLVKTYEKKATSVKPVFLLHDAMIIDVHKDDLKFVKETTTVRVKGYVQRHFLHVDELTSI